MKLFSQTALFRNNTSIYLPVTAPVWYEASDLSTLRQERTGAAATTPVGVGDPIGSVFNKGTAGGWATAPSDAERPTLAKVGDVYYMVATGGTNIQLDLPAEQVSALGSDCQVTYGAYFDDGGPVLVGSGVDPNERLHTGVDVSSGNVVIKVNGGGAETSGTAYRDVNIVVSARYDPTYQFIRVNGVEVATSTATSGHGDSSMYLFDGGRTVLIRAGDVKLTSLVGRGPTGLNYANTVIDEQYCALKTGLSFQST